MDLSLTPLHEAGEENMKVLVPIAGAADAKLILDFIANYCWPPGSEFRVMTILDFDYLVDGVLPVGDEAEGAQLLLKSVVQRTKRSVANCAVTAEVAYGETVERIIERAHQWPADMIIMGYRVRNEAQRFLAGSVSRSVCLRAPCSVAVIRPPILTTAHSFDRNSSIQQPKSVSDVSGL